VRHSQMSQDQSPVSEQRTAATKVAWYCPPVLSSALPSTRRRQARWAEGSGRPKGQFRIGPFQAKSLGGPKVSAGQKSRAGLAHGAPAPAGNRAWGATGQRRDDKTLLMVAARPARRGQAAGGAEANGPTIVGAAVQALRARVLAFDLLAGLLTRSAGGALKRAARR
jgi:hypothetical protein